MKIATIGWRCRAVFRAAVLLAAVVGALLVSGVTAAEREASPPGPTKAANQPESGKGKRGDLTVGIVLIDPNKTNDRRPAADALVHIEGSDDWYTTDDKGRAKLSEISTGKVTLQIKVIGAAICRLRDISVTGGDQLVNVLIEKAQDGKCWRE